MKQPALSDGVHTFNRVHEPDLDLLYCLCAGGADVDFASAGSSCSARVLTVAILYTGRVAICVGGEHENKTRMLEVL